MDSNIINGVSNSVKNNMKQLELILQNVLSSTKLRLEMYLVIHENVHLDVLRVFMWKLTPTLSAHNSNWCTVEPITIQHH